jgi:threonine/homoserine/homoserine lactone efflux protein
MDIILKGVLSGLVLALLVGPVFFTILQTSIERGFWSGVLVAIGVSVSDSVYILLCYLGLSQTFEDNQAQIYLAYVGGVVLFGFGAYYLFIKSRRLTTYDARHIRESNPVRLLAKGFIINGLSPMVLIFWLGTVGIATGELGYTSPPSALAFFCSIVATVLITDILKAKLADKLRQILTTRIIRTMNIVLGLIMLIFGGRLILFAGQVVY